MNQNGLAVSIQNTAAAALPTAAVAVTIPASPAVGTLRAMGGGPPSFFLPTDEEMTAPPGDRLYPHEFPVKQKPFGMVEFNILILHLLVWHRCRAMTTSLPLGADIYMPHFGQRWDTPLLLFRTREARAAFREWWRRYSRFYTTHDMMDCFLPGIPKGRVSGQMVPHALTFEWPEARALDAVPVWSWIVYHCRKPVWRVADGWVFRSRTDAAKFLVCDYGKDLAPGDAT